MADTEYISNYEICKASKLPSKQQRLSQLTKINPFMSYSQKYPEIDKKWIREYIYDKYQHKEPSIAIFKS